MRNLAALKEAGFVHPLKAMAVVKDLPVGSSFTLSDGTVVSQEAVEPPRPGRKVVICGDTASARAMETLARGADVVVHEATNTCKFVPLFITQLDLVCMCVFCVFV
jgi:ribonuclease Z